MSVPADDEIRSLIDRFIRSRQSGERISLEALLKENGWEPGDPEACSIVRQKILSAFRAEAGASPGKGPGQTSRAGVDARFDLIDVEGYDVVDFIASGAMGLVYEAYQRSTGRRVAIKVLREAVSSSEAARRRFEREVELVARLQHPHLVSVFDSGFFRDRCFFVMEFVDGRPLDQAFRPGDCEVSRVLDCMALICDAVDYAHERGVLHRDLKPSNILADEKDQPHVLDFGLAKAMDDDITKKRVLTLSRPGEIFGTLGYMAPEQALGKHEQVSIRSDVYSLGVVLYELLTGVLPCDVSGHLDVVLGRISQVPPLRPSVARQREAKSATAGDLKGISRADLDAIVLKSLEKSPADRYPSAAALADDLRRLRRFECVSARHAGWAVQATRWAGRNRRVVGVAAISALILLSTLIAAYVRILRERNRAQEAVIRTADVLASMGALRKNLSEYAQARELLEGALAIRKQEQGERSSAAAKTENLLGEVLFARGEFRPAELCFRNALPVLRADANALDDLARCLRNLGWVKLERNDADGAEPYINEALAIQRKYYGERHTEIADTLQKVGLLHKVRHQFPESERYFREALKMLHICGSDDHMLVAFDLESIAGSLWEQEKIGEAEQTYRESLALRRLVLTPELARSCHYLGWLLIGRNNVEAESLLREALAIRQRVFQGDHPYVAQNLHRLGQCLLDAHRPGEAVEYLQEAYGIRTKQLPSYLPEDNDPPQTRQHSDSYGGVGMAMEPMDRIDVADLLADCYVQLGQFEAAARFAREVFYGRSKILGVKHEQTQAAFDRLIATWKQLGMTDEIARVTSEFRPAGP